MRSRGAIASPRGSTRRTRGEGAVAAATNALVGGTSACPPPKTAPSVVSQSSFHSMSEAQIVITGRRNSINRPTRIELATFGLKGPPWFA
jgi:hypothetical protein